MNPENPRYFSFLLRLWQEKSGTQSAWRASLENPHNGKRLGFSDIHKFLAYIAEITEEGKSWNKTNSEQKPEKSH